jgi:hypothetical protein
LQAAGQTRRTISQVPVAMQHFRTHECVMSTTYHVSREDVTC